MKRLFTFFLSIVFTIAQAQIITSEDFASASDGTNLSSYNGWTPNSSNGGLGDCGLCIPGRMQIKSRSLSYSGYGSYSYGVLFGGDVDAPGKFFPSQINLTGSNSVYFAVLVDFSAGSTVATQGDFLRVYSTSSFSTVVRFMATKSGNQIKFAVNGSSNAATSYTNDYLTGQHLLVIKYQSVTGEDNDVMTLWVDPPSQANEPSTNQAIVTSSDGNTNFDPTVIKGWAFRGTTTPVTNLPSGYVGGMKVSSSYGALFGIIPVEMRDFTASAQRGKNVLNWTTENEKNASHFSIEKSANGETGWTSIGQVKAAGNSNVTRKYSLEDPNPLAVSYYRIKTIDADGSSEISKVVSVAQTGLKNNVRLFPQPTEHVLTAQFDTKTAGTASITIADAAGRSVFSQKLATTEGVNNLQIPTANLATGIYFLQIADGTMNQTEKFFKK